MEVDKKDVGQRIKSIRLSKGMTLEEFGKLFGASRGNVSLWEKGSSIPNNERLKQISEMGSLSVDELLYGTIADRVFLLSKDTFKDIELSEELKEEVIDVTTMLAEHNSEDFEISNNYLVRSLKQNLESLQAIDYARSFIKSRDEVWHNRTTNKTDSTKSYIKYVSYQLDNLIEDANKQKDTVNVKNMNKIIEVLERSKQELAAVLNNLSE